MFSVETVSNIRDRVAQMGCYMQEGITLMPHNLETSESNTDLRRAIESPTCKTLFKNAGLKTDYLITPEAPLYTDNHAADWIGPAIFISATLLSENPHCVSIALNVLSNYLFLIFTHNESSEVEFKFLLEENGAKRCKKLSYKGPVSGLKDLPSAIREVSRER